MVPILAQINQAPQSFSEARDHAKVHKARWEISMLDQADWMKRALQLVQHLCCICVIHHPSEAQGNHTLMRCETLLDFLRITWSDYKEWRGKLQYRRHHSKICFVCHVPQINDSVHPTFTKVKKGERIECEHADILAPLAFSIWHHATTRRRAEAHFGVTWGGGTTQIAEWLMGKPRTGSHSNLVDLFLWYTETQLQQE